MSEMGSAPCSVCCICSAGYCSPHRELDCSKRNEKMCQEVPSKHQKTLFFLQGCQHCHRLPREFVESSSMEIFKSRVDMVLCNARWPCLSQDQVTSTGPFQHQPFCDFVALLSSPKFCEALLDSVRMGKECIFCILYLGLMLSGRRENYSFSLNCKFSS